MGGRRVQVGPLCSPEGTTEQEQSGMGSPWRWQGFHGKVWGKEKEKGKKEKGKWKKPGRKQAVFQWGDGGRWTVWTHWLPAMLYSVICALQEERKG